jgi:hypothetical protein
MTESKRNGCNGLQRAVVAHVHEAFAPQAATGATPPIGALPVAPACVGAAPFVGKLQFVSATMKKPPRGMRASRNGKWLLTSSRSSALPPTATLLPDGRPVRLPRSGPTFLARHALETLRPSPLALVRNCPRAGQTLSRQVHHSERRASHAAASVKHKHPGRLNGRQG